MGDSELVRTLESAQGISLGGSVLDSVVVITTTLLAVVIGLLVVLVWRRSWDQSGDKEVKPVV
jgi:NADPH-ferrihemoprotein reductase